ncbi:TetR/AcrR family transcriptional regulator [Maridesulfovibrio sp. FT414]|uniref:TetR/AcrR family transcriptional regulator n=1 Tax=Maridesulfovibrio sp. FT414 TaxID=2979469 RepID=UPI003D803E11
MTRAKAGRPRSEKSQQAVLDAVCELLDEGGGAALSIEGIAKRAGVGKPTIYRWWPSLADIVLEALLKQADARISIPVAGSGQERLRSLLRKSMISIAEGSGVHLRFLMAEAQKDEGFRQRFREHFVEQRRGVLRSVIEQVQGSGKNASGQSSDLLVDMVFGAMWYRLLTGHGPLNEKFADELTELVLKLAD